MSGEEVDGDRSDQTELGYERREAPLARHYRTRQRHRHPKPKTLRCLPSPPSVSPPSAPPCASRAAPPSPRCVSRGAPIEDSCHARTLPDVTHRVVPGTRRPRAVRARRTPRDTANAPRHERGVAFARARACSPRAAVAARRSRSASRTNLGFFSRGQEPVSTSKTGGLDRPRDRVESARGRRSPIRTPPAHDAGRSRTVRSRSGTRASPRARRRERIGPIGRIRSRTTRRPTTSHVRCRANRGFFFFAH
jgi:hypothetical protein